MGKDTHTLYLTDTARAANRVAVHQSKTDLFLQQQPVNRRVAGGHSYSESSSPSAAIASYSLSMCFSPAALPARRRPWLQLRPCRCDCLKGGSRARSNVSYLAPRWRGASGPADWSSSWLVLILVLDAAAAVIQPVSRQFAQPLRTDMYRQIDNRLAYNTNWPPLVPGWLGGLGKPQTLGRCCCGRSSNVVHML